MRNFLLFVEGESDAKFLKDFIKYKFNVDIVDGNIIATKKVTMMPPAIFRGTVTTPSLKIDEGVVFEGASYVPKA